MNEGHFNKVGWSTKDIPVVVSGMPEGSPFPALFIGNRYEEEREVLQGIWNNTLTPVPLSLNALILGLLPLCSGYCQSSGVWD